jgi:hypothetical protein
MVVCYPGSPPRGWGGERPLPACRPAPGVLVSRSLLKTKLLVVFGGGLAWISMIDGRRCGVVGCASCRWCLVWVDASIIFARGQFGGARGLVHSGLGESIALSWWLPWRDS